MNMDMEMSQEMKDKMMKVADKMGMDRSMMTEKMMHGMKKSMMGGMKMMDEMKSQGMDDSQAMGMMGKFQDAMMSEGMPEMMEGMKEEKSEM